MSNKLMNDFQMESSPADFRRAFRRTWIISGLVLWGLVFVAATALFILRHRERSANDAAAPAALVLSGSPSAAAVSGQPSTAASSSPPIPWSKAGVEDFVFTERSGRKVTKADLLGHPWLISFIFTRCAGPCPRVSARMSELQTLLAGTDVRLVTLTVDPDFDTADVLKHYADAYRADPKRWLYLTGDKRKTYGLINNSFLMPVQEYTGKDREPGNEVMHSTNILRVNEKGQVVDKYNALDEVAIARLRKDLGPYLDAKRSNARADGGDAPPAKPSANPPKGSSH